MEEAMKAKISEFEKNQEWADGSHRTAHVRNRSLESCTPRVHCNIVSQPPLRA